MSKETGGSAFPELTKSYMDRRDDSTAYESTGGMTLHAYFAAKAMQAAITGHITHFGHENYWPPVDIAEYANEVADAMVERAK